MADPSGDHLLLALLKNNVILGAEDFAAKLLRAIFKSEIVYLSSSCHIDDVSSGTEIQNQTKSHIYPRDAVIS